MKSNTKFLGITFKMKLGSLIDLKCMIYMEIIMVMVMAMAMSDEKG